MDGSDDRGRAPQGEIPRATIWCTRVSRVSSPNREWLDESESYKKFLVEWLAYFQMVLWVRIFFFNYKPNLISSLTDNNSDMFNTNLIVSLQSKSPAISLSFFVTNGLNILIEASKIKWKAKHAFFCLS